MNAFGELLREKREKLRVSSKHFSLRKVADRVGLEPSYLSKIERGDQPPPSEEKIVMLAAELDLDSDVLLALAGKISSDLHDVIQRRPVLFSQLIRDMKDLPDDAILRIVREVRDGEW